VDVGTVTMLKECEGGTGQEWALQLHGTRLSGVYVLRTTAENFYKFEKKR
jgi:hypothetical protein